jgi:hypothetical protein
MSMAKRMLNGEVWWESDKTEYTRSASTGGYQIVAVFDPYAME